jgi:hypothetical protein
MTPRSQDRLRRKLRQQGKIVVDSIFWLQLYHDITAARQKAEI